MLVDVTLHPSDPVLTRIARAVAGDNAPPRRLARGFYLTGHFSFEHECREKLDAFDFNTLDPSAILEDIGLHEYGVCDTPEQFMERFGAALDALPGRWVVSFTVVKKADEPSDGGWRWRKWGPYIGDKRPGHEYLHDEGPEITQATCFRVYRVHP